MLQTLKMRTCLSSFWAHKCPIIMQVRERTIGAMRKEDSHSNKEGMSRRNKPHSTVIVVQKQDVTACETNIPEDCLGNRISVAQFSSDQEQASKEYTRAWRGCGMCWGWLSQRLWSFKSVIRGKTCHAQSSNGQCEQNKMHVDGKSSLQSYSHGMLGSQMHKANSIPHSDGYNSGYRM
jgi:hypothetical protein